MAIDMKRIYGTNNAFEYSESVLANAADTTSEEIFIPSNVASVTFGINRLSGTGMYKIQTTYSPKDEVTAGTAKWFDWEISGVDENGWFNLDKVQWWLPVPGSIRLVVEGVGSDTTVYWAMRAN